MMSPDTRPMTRDIASNLLVGDVIRPLPMWNRTEPSKARKIDDAVGVIDITRGGKSQTGCMVKVRTQNGGTITIDAGWFYPPERLAKRGAQ